MVNAKSVAVDGQAQVNTAGLDKTDTENSVEAAVFQALQVGVEELDTGTPGGLFDPRAGGLALARYRAVHARK